MDMFGKKAGKEERASWEVAEASRQAEWKPGSFLRGLYEGKYLWDLVFPFPEQSAEDKKIGDEYLEAIESFLKENLDPEHVDQTGEIPEEVVRKLFEMGAFALKIPAAYGGMGLSKVNYGRVMHLISSYCSSTAVLLSAHQSIGVPQPLLDFGTEEQKRKYLPRFRKNTISGFALTEPDAGSDPSRMATTATPIEDGKFFLLNGEKLWCTNGVIADILIVMALTPPQKVDGKEKKQITAFIVETDTPGFEVKHRCSFMGLHGAKIGLLKFTNVKVPRENIVAGEGAGLKLALTTLNTGRLTLPATVTGACKYALRVSRLWASKRVQWGAPIGTHEAVAAKLAGMAASVLGMEAVTWYVTHAAMRPQADVRLESAMAKKFCTEMCWAVMNEAFQIRGGRGYETSKSLEDRGEGETAYPIERLIRDARIGTIVEGTSEIMDLFITREALDTHLKKMMPLFNPKTGFLKKMSTVINMAISYALWYPRLWLPVLAGRNANGIPSGLQGHVVYAERMARRLARGMFHGMMIHRQTIAKKENLASRYVEIGGQLFAISTVCSYAASRIKKGIPEKDLTVLADLFCRTARSKIDRLFNDVHLNQDRLKNTVAKNVLSGQYEWLESDIIK